MDSGLRTSIRKKLGELLVEAGIVKAEQLPKGLEYAQKATEADLAVVAEVRQLILEHGLDVPTALRALSLTKQRRCGLDIALRQVGWHSRKNDPAGYTTSSFSRSELDAIGASPASQPVLTRPAVDASGSTPAGASAPAQPAFSKEQLDAIGTRQVGEQAPAQPAFSKEQLDAIGTRQVGEQAPAHTGFSKAELDAIATKQASERAPAQPAFSKAELDAIGVKNSGQKAPAQSPFSKSELDAIGAKQPVKETSVQTSFSKDELDAIGTQKPGDQLAANSPFSKEELDAIASPNGQHCIVAGAESAPPGPSRRLWNSKQPSTGSAAADPQQPSQGAPKPVTSTMDVTAMTKIVEAEKLLAAGEFQQSEVKLLEALHLLEASPKANVSDVADVLCKLGGVALRLSEFTRCEKYLTRALKIREAYGGSDSIGVSECLDALAELYDQQSQFLEAEQFYLSALGIKEKVLAPGSSEVTASLKKLVAVSKRSGPRPEEKLSGQLLTEAGLLDAHSVERGLMLAQEQQMPIGRALVSLNFLTEEDLKSVLQAQLLLREGVLPSFLAIRALRISSQQRIAFVTALKEMGLEASDPEVAAAFQLLQLADRLVDAERELPPDHPELASLCLKLGDLHVEHRRFQQAQSLYKRAAAISEKGSPDDRSQYIEIHMRLAHLHYSLTQYSEAEVLYGKLMALFEQDGSYSDPLCISVIENLATVKYMRSHFEEAGKLYELAIGAKQKALGPKHPGLVTALQGRANCFYMERRYDDAEDLYRFAIAVIENVFGVNAEQVAGAAAVLGDMYFVQGFFDKAQREYLHSLDSLSNAANPDVQLFCTVLEKLARCCIEQNDLARADAYYRHFEKTRHSCGTDRYADMADAFERHAQVLEKMGQRDESAIARQKAQVIRGAGR